MAAQQAIRDEIERQPSAFMLRRLSGGLVGARPDGEPRLRQAADAVARFLNVRGQDLVFVDNATAGANAVFRSIRLAPGDEILVLDHAYGAVALVAAFAARERGAVVRTVRVPFPSFDANRLIDDLDRAITPQTRLVVIDHITSGTAIVLPVAELAARAHAHGAPVFVDGAHAPGAIPVDIASLGADWYAANLHKWAMAPRSCGVLWAHESRQAGLHPPVISWGLDQGFLAEFDWVGTRDPSPWLAAPEGIAFLEDLDIARVYAWNHGLACDAAAILTEAWGTAVGVPSERLGTMVAVPTPLACGTNLADAARLRDALLFDHAIEVHTFAAADRVWVRISAQVYTERAEIERLADVVTRL
jgi:isopenicillin-N epimerase